MESFFILNSNYWSKTEKIFKLITKIDQSAMCYISMDLTLQALQTNGKLFSKFRNHFSNSLQFFNIIAALGLCMRGGGGICADQHALFFFFFFAYPVNLLRV